MASSPELRGVEVTCSLDAPSQHPGEVIAGVLERTVNRHLTRSFTKAAAAHIAAAADAIVEMRPEAGSYWTTALQHTHVERHLADFLDAIQADLARDFRARLLTELAASVAPRLSPKGSHRS